LVHVQVCIDAEGATIHLADELVGVERQGQSKRHFSCGAPLGLNQQREDVAAGASVRHLLELWHRSGGAWRQGALVWRSPKQCWRKRMDMWRHTGRFLACTPIGGRKGTPRFEG